MEHLIADTAINTIRLLPFSKQQVEIFSAQIKESLESGDVDPLELAIYFKAIEKVAEAVKDTLSQLALNEAQKNGKSFEFKGAKVEVREVGVKYDYATCGDTEWKSLDADVQTATEKRKEREAFLKGLSDSINIVNKNTGEVEEIFPPLKKSTTGIAISLK